MSEEGFAVVLKAINKWDSKLRTELRKELRAAGEEIADEARARAGMYSKSIPPTIKVRTSIQSRQAEIRIKAGSAQVPLAGLFELGNKGGKAHGGKFRHPVFGDTSTWASQRMHPFLAPAVKRHEATVLARVGKAVDAANETIGGFA